MQALLNGAYKEHFLQFGHPQRALGKTKQKNEENPAYMTNNNKRRSYDEAFKRNAVKEFIDSKSSVYATNVYFPCWFCA